MKKAIGSSGLFSHNPYVTLLILLFTGLFFGLYLWKLEKHLPVDENKKTRFSVICISPIIIAITLFYTFMQVVNSN